LNTLANESLKISEELINKVTESKFAKVTFAFHMYMQTMKTNVSRSSKKFQSSDSLNVFSCPNTNIITISTPCPTDRSSGASYSCGKIHKRDAKSLELEWIGPYTYYTIPNSDYIYWETTDSCSYNWVAANASERMMWGSITIASVMLELEIDLTTDFLYWSLFWNFARSIKGVLDLMYTYYKSAIYLGNFGKLKITEEVETINSNDIRVSTMMFRLGMNYGKYASSMIESVKDKYKQMIGENDPVFNKPTTGWTSFLMITYLKQIYQKEDGADEVAIKSVFVDK
jgi:hypothetical protein